MPDYVRYDYSMKKGYIRFLKLFLLLTTEEQHRCVRYLNYKLYEGDPRLPGWFEAVKETGTYESAWEKQFPGKEYNAATAFQLSERITGHIESFMAVEMLEQDPVRKAHLLITSLLGRGGPDLFYSALNRAIKEIHTLGFRSVEYFRQLATYESLGGSAQMIHYQGYKPRYFQLDEERNRRSQDLNIAMETLLVAVARIGAGKPPGPMATSAFEVLESYSKDEPVADLLCLIYQQIKERRVLSADETTRLFDTWKYASPMIHPESRGHYYLLVLNLLIRQASLAGSGDDLEKTLLIYEDIINQPSVHFERRHYHNLIRLCIRLAEKSENAEIKEKYLKKAHKILESFQRKLPENEREGYYLYNRAQIYFAESDFAALKAQMPQLDVFDLLYESNYRFLWLQAIYELDMGEFDLPDRLMGLERWVKNQKWKTADQLAQHTNSVIYFRKLVTASNTNVKRLIALRDKLVTIPCNRKDWLLKKFEEKITAATR